MQRLQRNAWLGLLVMSMLIGLVGLWALFVRITEDASVPLGLTGRSLSELATESPDGYRFADFGVRAGGLGPVVNGTLLATIVVFAFRQHRRWAWWAMWVLPIWGASAFVLILAIGVSPGQAPPWPMISGSIVAVFSAALLLFSAPRFIGRRAAD
ncbi:MAG: hypothetical protein ABI553_09780 [Chloroflexota bacterium]